MAKKTSFKISPLHDRVVIKQEERELKTKGGLFIPETSRSRIANGVCVAIGDGINGVQMTVKVGDKVVYPNGTGTEIEVDSEKYLIMKEQDILAVV